MSTIDQQAMYWAVRQSDHTLDEAQRREFDTWLAADLRHQGAYLRAVAINRALNQATVQESLRPKRERLEAEWAGAPWRQNGLRRAFLMAGGAAAGAACLALTRLFSGADKTVLTTAKGEFRKVPLADKSVADINSGSQLEVRMTPQQRQVMLKKGEVWLEVAKDKTKPFIVEAGAVRVRAVGTAFGVRRYGNGAEVLVTEGTVEVWSDQGSARKRLLTAGERTFVPDQAARIAVARQPVEVQRKLAWREGKLIFDNQTLSEAVADFNRYSQKKIVIGDPAIGSKTLVGQYQIDAPELFARDVAAFLQIPVAITAENIVIGESGRG
jgi:transmembrane sensor